MCEILLSFIVFLHSYLASFNKCKRSRFFNYSPYLFFFKEIFTVKKSLLSIIKFVLFTKFLRLFSIDISFICLPNILINEIETILRKYQITINHILNAKYIERFKKDTNEDIFMISMKMIDGYNENEVLIVPKIQKNLSFFERFFNFFS